MGGVGDTIVIFCLQDTTLLSRCFYKRSAEGCRQSIVKGNEEQYCRVHTPRS